MNYMLKVKFADAVHPYFTASKFYPLEIERAFEDGKEKYINVLKQNLEAIETLTLSDYCKATGSNINKG